MSAPNAGRQSPDPERQTSAQQQQPPASDPNKQGMAKSDSHPADVSKNALNNLDSNPTHVLEKEAEKKTSKEE